MKKIFLQLLVVHFTFTATAQSYISYFTGDTTDVITEPMKGVCLMGGAGEDDNAMRWFLQRADGGDILVMRADDSDGYNDYMFSELGVEVNSVETIVCNSALASTDAYVLQQIENAEAIWFAGGDQWNYISYWKDTEVEDALNYCINTKGITVGGLSAGMAIMGENYFSAENGSITSPQALNNPYSNLLTLGFGDFLENPLMEKIITDTHFNDPDRRGRTTTFLARILLEKDYLPYAIACNEYTAVCIDENKIAHAFGEYPDYDDIVYFVQVNCKEPNEPELCVDDEKLHWVRDSAALKVVKMFATYTGDATFDLNNWQTVNSSAPYTWENWWVEDGDFLLLEDAPPVNCDTTSAVQQFGNSAFHIFPNPAQNEITLHFSQNQTPENIFLYDVHGKLMAEFTTRPHNTIDISGLANGLYIIAIHFQNSTVHTMFLKE